MKEQINQEVHKRLYSYLDFLEQGLKDSGDFVSTQMPLVIQEFYAWAIGSRVFQLLICIILLYLGYKATSLVLREAKRLDNIQENKNIERNGFLNIDQSNTDTVFIYSLVGVFGSMYFLGLSIWLFKTFYILLKLYIAPRIYLLQYLQETLR